MTELVRTLVVWCPDWPVVAAGAVAGLSPRVPAAVVAANRVVACSAPARADGVRRGMRRREAQSRCPELAVFGADPGRDARAFEPVVAAVEELAPGAEVIRPGVVAVPARGPVGYYGDPVLAAERLVDQVAARAGAECQVGVADGLFAATLAAHRGWIIPPGGSTGFLAPLGIHELAPPGDPDAGGRAELVDLLNRLGLRTLGAFAALAERDVASRFGRAAVAAHRLARGIQWRPPGRRAVPPDLAVVQVLDPPAVRVDAVAFAAKSLADRLHAGLVAHGLACTRLGIHAQTEHGAELSRIWHCADPLSASGIADRVRWQLDGWLRAAAPETYRPATGVSLLRLEPEEVVAGGALQIGLWRGAEDSAAEDERAGRALVRVQGLLGPDGVCTPVLGGGRGAGDQVRLVPWGDERVPAADPVAPWPGRLPSPSPALVFAEPLVATVFDAAGAEVGVSGRHTVDAVPYQVSVAGRAPRRVRGWAGPWSVDERWWQPDGGARRTRLQVLVDDGDHGEAGLLLIRENGRWTVEGTYE